MPVLEASSAMTNIGTLFTQFTTWMGSMVTTIASNELLLLPVGIFCVGATIGLCRRLIGR